MGSEAPQSILVTGAAGNLGRKLIAHLLERPWCKRVVGIDRAEPRSRPAEWDDRVDFRIADLTNPQDARWGNAFLGIQAAVHLAAQNPDPDAPWDDACASFDMTLHVVEAVRQTGVRRFVFASSNHTMGRYKDPPLAGGLCPGDLTTALVPAPGTRWHNGREIVDGVAYGTSKLMGERVCIAEAELSKGALTTVSVRIGWCQPGENRPTTINPSGIVGEPPALGPEAERDLRWFRGMWLSNRDFVHLMEQSLLADASGWPAPGIVVNGMSANRDMVWDIETAGHLLGYAPQDDLWRQI
jgi:nucleoside-diphosphate-sugar epimerase